MLQRQQQEFARAFNQLNEEIINTMQLLQGYYEEAFDRMQNGKYIVNTGIIKELRMYLSQITKIANFAGDGTKLFLLSIGRNNQQEMPQPNIDKFVEKYRDCTQIHMSKLHLEPKVMSKIRNRCSSATSVVLVSNTLTLDQIICDGDLAALKPLSRMSSLSLKNSNVTEQGLRILHQQFAGLKELDISGCRFIGNGFRWLSGYKYVSIKANRIENVTLTAIISLVATSYNLNYLQINDLPEINYNEIIEQIGLTYLQNKLNFKWLQLQCNAGTILFVNKLAYLTQLTTVDSINDREVEILIGEQPLLDGLYFNCCERLHSETMNMLIKRCSKLRRLGVRRFVNLSDSLLGDLVASLPRLQHLDLSQCCSLTNRALIHIANQLSRLKEINLTRCFRIEDEGLLYLIQKMPSIQSIDLSYCKNVTDNVVFKICDYLPSLISFNLTKCDQISNESISYISQKLLSLKALILNGCEGLTDASLSLVAMRLRKLARLQIQWCGASQKCVDFIVQNLNNLRILNLNYCHTVCDEALMGLSKYASKLQSLSLASCEVVTQRGFIRLFGSLKQLRELDLRQCVGVSDLGIEKLCQTTKGKLVKLDFGWCTNITDNSILYISQFQHQLLYLSLNGCVGISDNAIVWLCTSATNLQYLNLSLCERLTDISVFQISKSLSHLRVLFLSELKKITDAAVSSLAGVQNLEQLHLSGCQQVTSSSLIALLHNLQKLQCLNISECSSIFAESLLLLVQRMRNLTKFSIASLQVSDSFLQMIGEYMQRLQVLNMQYCRKITDQGVLKMVFRVPSLLRIDLQNSCVSQKTKKSIFDQLSTRSLYNVVY